MAEQETTGTEKLETELVRQKAYTQTLISTTVIITCKLQST
jgi:hypothetical protein